MTYQYKNGQQPLAGYTIKRGVGKGGFGEVYFAVSDSGKEVALKMLRGRADVELRGVGHCLNLKHPNLVHIYDQKTDDQGTAWIVMEYILGESLADVLDRHPQGLPTHLARDWFQSLARAVGFLHDHGVLHRDLKPANVFLENGTVKVGDYGLCKTIGSPSERQTRNVGTVHYMAPEVGNGKYGRSVDIYACGAILFEMLVGRPPFDGDSDAEVLIKHSTETPDLSQVPVAFREVVARGLNKDPEKRYTSMAEFARAVDAVPMPGAVPAAEVPPPLPIPAKAIPKGPPVASRVPDHLPATPLPMSSAVNAIPKTAAVAAPAAVCWSRSFADLFGGYVKAAILCGLGVIPFALATQTDSVAQLGKLFAVAFAVSAGVMTLSFRVGTKNANEWPLRLRMAALGCGIAGLMFWLDGRTLGGSGFVVADDEPGTSFVRFGDRLSLAKVDSKALTGYALYFAACLGLCRWWLMAARDRKESWSVSHPIAAAFFGTVLMFLWPHDANSGFEYGLVPLIIASIAIPLSSGWQAPPAPLPRKLRAR
jgi:hypothetical protein